MTGDDREREGVGSLTLTQSATHPPDEVLVREARQGNAQAFDLLIGRHFGTVYAIAYSRLGHRESAEDLAQEVFLRSYLQLTTLRDDARYAGWVALMARNLAIDWQRRGERSSRLLPLVPLEDTVDRHLEDPAKDASEAMAEREQLALAQEAILKLPPDLREVVMLHYTEDLSKSEIARRLGVHPSTVGRQLETALEKLKGSVENRLKEGARALRPRRAAAAQAMAIIAITASLAPEAKAALTHAAISEGGSIVAASATAACSATTVAETGAGAAALAGGSAAGGAGVGAAGSGSLGATLHTVWTTLTGAMTGFGMIKTAAVTVCAVGAITGGTYVYEAAQLATVTGSGGSTEFVMPTPKKTHHGNFEFGKDYTFDLRFNELYTMSMGPNPLGIKEGSLMVMSDGKTYSESRLEGGMVTMSIGEIKFDAPLTDIDGKTGVGLSISHRFEPTKDGGRVTYWGCGASADGGGTESAREILPRRPDQRPGLPQGHRGDPPQEQRRSRGCRLPGRLLQGN
jgi:RNA polymerase sigma factor (sigma-70 family)